MVDLKSQVVWLSDVTAIAEMGLPTLKAVLIFRDKKREKNTSSVAHRRGTFWATNTFSEFCDLYFHVLVQPPPAAM